MILNTCSQVMSLAKELEGKSANFYRDLSKRFGEEKDLFLSLADENEGHVTHIERAYYGVITDAIEGCFAFNIDPEKYSLKMELSVTTDLSDALTRALEIEEKMIAFYSDAAEQSKSLMADVPRAFRMVVKKRAGRQTRLKTLLDRKGG
jgi:rubrerythrin